MKRIEIFRVNSKITVPMNNSLLQTSNFKSGTCASASKVVRFLLILALVMASGVLKSQNLSDDDPPGPTENCNCPSNWEEIVIPYNSVFISSIYPNQNSVQNKCFIVYGTLVINKNFDFTNCRFFQKSNSSITVRNSSRMGLSSCRVRSCDTLWQGISLEDNSSISSISSFIHNARFGIYNVEGSSKNLLLVKNTSFINNVIGIFNPPNAGIMDFGPDFTGNRFFGDGVLPTAPNPEDPEWPEPGQISHAGMVIHNSHFKIGKASPSSTEINRFTNMMCGIAVFNNYVTIKGCIFSNLFNTTTISIRPYFFDIGVRSGIAVHSQANNGFSLLDLEGFGKFGTTAINSTNIGVNVVNGACFVYNCRMTDLSSGVVLSNQKTNLVGSNPIGSEISNNFIQCRQMGIFISECENNLINVQTNDISHINSGYYGIACVNNTNGRINLIDNVIGTLRDGIYLNNSPNSFLLDNNVTLLRNALSYGFFSIRSNESIFNCNGVNSPHNTLSPSRIGFFTSSCNDLRMECNAVAKCGRAYYFPSVSMNVDYLTNSKQNCAIGLHQNEFSVIGPQESKGNTFSGSFDIGAKHDGASQFIIDMSKFIVQSNTSLDYPFGTTAAISLPNAPPNTDWYYTFGERPLCASNPEGCSPFPSRIIDDIDVLVMDWPTESDPGLIASRYYAQRYLYQKLHRDSDYRNSDQSLLTFYTDHQNSEIGRFDSIDHQIQKLHFTTVDDSLDLLQIQIQIDTVLDQILSFDETFGEISELTSASELQERSTLFHQLDSLFSLSQLLRYQISEQAISKAQNLLSVIQSLSTTSSITELEKTVNIIRLDMFVDGRQTPDSTELTSLTEIAQLCPYTDGFGVHSARALIASITDVQYDDDSICAAATQQLISVSKEPVREKLKATLSPNPASESLLVKILNYEEGARIRMISSDGKLVLERNLNSGSELIQISHIPIGIYFVNVYIGDESLYLKFIKQ